MDVHLWFPDTVMSDPVEAFATVLWLYMTPHFPKPSAHSVITGFFVPNVYDLNRGLGNDFGTSITTMA